MWTWTAIDADSELILSWLCGDRDADAAYAFMRPGARLSHRVQLTTDGHRPYLAAVEDAFGADIDYAMLQKIYGAEPRERKAIQSRRCASAASTKVSRATPIRSTSTRSYVERQNLTMRMHMRRFTRLTNALSKKVENHAHSVALHFMLLQFL